MSTIPANFGQGGVGLQPEHGTPSLATALRDVAADLADMSGGLADWSAELTVASHTVALPRAGVPIAVEATTATSAGVKQLQFSGSPAAGFVRAVFTAGVATLTFNATDAVTKARVLLSPSPASIRTIAG
jgi:predicted secreted protein